MSDSQSKIYCPVTTAIHVIGGKYKALILWHLMSGPMRFSEIRTIVPQATPKMLTQQLRDLEKDGVINRKVYAVVPPKVEYSLTDKGESLIPLLNGMYEWGKTVLKEKGLEPNCTMTKDNRCCGK